MDNKNATMILKGLNSNSNHDLIDCKYEQPYSNCDINNPRHYGMPFEAKAALEMINNFRLSMLGKKTPSGEESPFEDIFFVGFNKASIFRILSQEQCEFIGFHFALPKKTEPGVDKPLENATPENATLVMMGFDIDYKPIKMDKIIAIAEEVDKDISKKDSVEYEKQPATEKAADTETTPQFEEKGNGGGSDFLKKHPQIVSMADFLEKNKALIGESFKDFLCKFYKKEADEFSQTRPVQQPSELPTCNP